MFFETSPLGSLGMHVPKVFVYWDQGGRGAPLRVENCQRLTTRKRLESVQAAQLCHDLCFLVSYFLLNAGLADKFERGVSGAEEVRHRTGVCVAGNLAGAHDPHGGRRSRDDSGATGERR